MDRALTTEVSAVERLGLAAAGGAAGLLGILMYFAPGAAASATGYPGTDGLVSQLGGAALLGFPLAIALGLGERTWAALRVVAVTLLTLGLGTLLACAFELTGGHPTGLSYAIMAVAVAITAVAGYTLYSHGIAEQGQPDTAAWVRLVLIVGTIAATTFGVLPLLFPVFFGQFAGLPGRDIFLYQLAGAACLSYALMGIYELRSRRWQEIRAPAAMALVFNGLGSIASIMAIVAGNATLLSLLVAPVAGVYAIATAISLQRKGK